MVIDIDLLKINPGCRVLHVGAHEAEELDMYVRSGWTEVVWIEAIPEKYDIVKSKISIYKDMMAFNYAAWSKSNLIFNFNQTNNGQSSSIYQLKKHSEVYPGITVDKVIPVKTISIDDLMKKINWQPDLICLDIQGAEYDALCGATQTLNKTKYIYTEVSYEELYADAVLEPQLTKFLNTIGFEKTIEVKAIESWGDAFYVKGES